MEQGTNNIVIKTKQQDEIPEPYDLAEPLVESPLPGRPVPEGHLSIVFAFAEDVQASTGRVALFVAGNAVPDAYFPCSSHVLFSGRRLVVPVRRPLQVGTRYRVTVEKACVLDAKYEKGSLAADAEVCDFTVVSRGSDATKPALVRERLHPATAPPEYTVVYPSYDNWDSYALLVSAIRAIVVIRTQ